MDDFELNEDEILDGLTGELDDYTAKKMAGPNGMSVTISMAPEGSASAEGGCSGCSMHCGGLVEEE